jgi:hypothetical protein
MLRPLCFAKWDRYFTFRDSNSRSRRATLRERQLRRPDADEAAHPSRAGVMSASPSTAAQEQTFRDRRFGPHKRHGGPDSEVRLHCTLAEREDPMLVGWCRSFRWAALARPRRHAGGRSPGGGDPSMTSSISDAIPITIKCIRVMSRHPGCEKAFYRGIPAGSPVDGASRGTASWRNVSTVMMATRNAMENLQMRLTPDEALRLV